MRHPDLVNRDFTAPGRRTVLWLGGLHVSALLGGRRVLQLRDRRRSAGRSSAGSSPPTCAQTSCWTRCGWRSGPVTPALTSPLTHTDAGIRNTPPYDYTQVLDDHGVLASVGSVGDAYDNAMAESFVDSFKTELIEDRVWRTDPSSSSRSSNTSMVQQPTPTRIARRYTSDRARSAPRRRNRRGCRQPTGHRALFERPRIA